MTTLDALTLDALTVWLNDEYPKRDWDQWCSKLVWNVVWAALDWPDERTIRPYDPALAGYRASRIESLDPATAPVGAIHWFQYPTPDGHVGVSLGGSAILMTGAAQAMTGGTMLGTNYGMTTVERYVKAKGNRYLGWSRTFGTNQSIVGLIGTTHAATAAEENEEEEMNIAMYRRVAGIYHVTIGNLGSGFELSYTTGSSAYNDRKAQQFKTGSFTEEDETVIAKFKAALADVRRAA